MRRTQNTPVRLALHRLRSALSAVPRRLRERGISAPGALAVAAGLAMVSAVPANALINADVPAPSAAASIGGPIDQHLSDIGGKPVKVSHDDFSVTAPPPVAAAPAPAPAAAAAPAPVAPASDTVVWPFPGAIKVSDGFGPRVSPCSGCSTMHQGTDMVEASGTPIHAIAAGTVKDVIVSDTGLGVHVVIEHVIDGQRLTSTYGHMLYGSPTVSVGQTVAPGDTIGLVGSTGDSTGPHMHFELRLNGTDAVDGYAWLQQHAG